MQLIVGIGGWGWQRPADSDTCWTNSWRVIILCRQLYTRTHVLNSTPWRIGSQCRMSRIVDDPFTDDQPCCSVEDRLKLTQMTRTFSPLLASSAAHPCRWLLLGISKGHVGLLFKSILLMLCIYNVQTMTFFAFAGGQPSGPLFSLNSRPRPNYLRPRPRPRSLQIGLET